MAVKSSKTIYASENEIALLKTGFFNPFSFTQMLNSWFPIHQGIH